MFEISFLASLASYSFCHLYLGVRVAIASASEALREVREASHFLDTTDAEEATIVIGTGDLLCPPAHACFSGPGSFFDLLVFHPGFG